MRVSLFALVILVLAACNNGETEYYDLKTNHEKTMLELKEKYLAATTQEEKMKIAQNAPDPAIYIDKILQLAKANPKSNYAADAWCQAFQMTWYKKDSIFTESMDQLSNKYVKSEHLANIEPMALLKGYSPEKEVFIQKVIAENPHDKVKAVFTLALAQTYTLHKTSKAYNLEKGLGLFEEIAEKYADIEIKHGDDGKLTKLKEIADNAIYNLTALAIGQKMPEVTCENLAGEMDKLSNYSGKVIVFDVWATWCGPCVAMIPHQRLMVDRLKDKAFQLISISLDSDVKKLKAFQEKEPMPWVNWFNGPKGGIVDSWNILQSPTVIILDKKGIIRHRSNGYMSDQELDKIVDQLVNEGA